MPQILPVIGAVASVVGTAGSLYFQAKSAAAQKDAAKAAKKQQNLQTITSNRAAVRQAQLARARAVMSSIGSGGVGGSGFYGGIGGLSSQLGGALGYQNQYNALSGQIGDFQSQANQASAMGNMFSGIGSLGAKVFNAAGGFSAFGQQDPQQSAPAFTPNYTYTNAYSPQPTQAPTPSIASSYNPATRPSGYI